MIEPGERFYSEGVAYFGTDEDPTDPACCNIFDFDQLRTVKMHGTARLFPFERGVEAPIFAQIADHLSPKVHSVTLLDDGLIVNISTDPAEDDTGFIGHFPLSTVESLTNCRTVQYSELREVDRLGPGVDLVSYEDESNKVHTVVFKYNVVARPLKEYMAWKELHASKSLPPHPNIVPFDRVVLEDVECRIIGFSTK